MMDRRTFLAAIPATTVTPVCSTVAQTSCPFRTTYDEWVALEDWLNSNPDVSNWDDRFLEWNAMADRLAELEPETPEQYAIKINAAFPRLDECNSIWQIAVVEQARVIAGGNA